ncbi:MAG: hypothetical protein QOF25_5227 [Mycobacterium sp.]|nr:hypothetical protein [Mycobacterium sp.]
MRVVLIILGTAIGGYGAVLLWDNSFEVIVRIAVWAVAARCCTTSCSRHCA